jgi:hypothetical protein
MLENEARAMHEMGALCTKVLNKQEEDEPKEGEIYKCKECGFSSRNYSHFIMPDLCSDCG